MEEAISVFSHNYWLIFVSSLVLAPEVVLFASAASAEQAALTVFMVVLLVSLGGSLGSIGIYFVSLLLGRQRLFILAGRLERYYLLNVSELHQAFDYFEKKGHWVVFFGRMAPTIRSLVSIPPGIIRMPLRIFLFFTFMGTFVWNLIIGYVFYFFWMHAETISSLLGIYAAVCLGFIIVLAVWLVGRNIVKRLIDN